MILNQQACGQVNLQELLKGDESSHSYQAAMVHVDDCPACQRKLEQLAADSGIWQEATSALSTNDNIGQSEVDHEPWTFPRSPVAWNESMASRLLSPPTHPEMLGSLGRYEIERLIGSGGMGLVFRAYDTELNRPVAIKLLAPYLAVIGSARKRFAREAKAAAAIMDEHVVAIHNVESSDDATSASFIVMKYIAGGSLQQRIDHDGPLDVCEILRIGLHTAKGLAAAHAQGLVHRDVKPSNILLDEGVERALLTDFGLARTEDDACLTRSGFQPGTPHYMSPEQVRGESIDARSDLFGLGCVMYAMCTGHPPFRAETSFAVLRRITDDTARSISEINPSIPTWLEKFVMKLLSKKRDERYDSAECVADLLGGCLAHLQQPSHQQLPAEVANLSPNLRRTSTWTKFLGAAACGIALAFASILILLEYNKGTLRITSEADNILIRLARGDTLVKEMTLDRSGKTVRITPGLYTLELVDTTADLELTHNTVSLRPGSVETVQLIKSEMQDEEKQDKESTGDAPSVTPNQQTPISDSNFILGGSVPIDDTKPSPERAELTRLKMEHARVRQAYSKACQQASDETELNRVYREMDPREIMPSKYLDFESKYRGTKSGFEALSIASNLATSGGGPNTAAGRDDAIGRLIDHYMHFEGFESVVRGLGGGVSSARTEELLNALVTKSPNLKTRAAALIQLIKTDKAFLEIETQVPLIRKQLSEHLAKAPPESPMQNECKRYLAKLDDADFNEIRSKANEKLEKLAGYCDTPVDFYGTAANAANRLDHAINKVVIGQPAPELVAADMDGNTFQLGKLRGKFVVLIFSQDKNFGEMYGPIRQLVARYRQAPVRVVGVMGNNTSEELKAARERDEISWTAIPEPSNGPLFQSWGMYGYPHAMIIGADGTLNPKIHMPYYGAGGYDTKEIRDELDKLLEKYYELNNPKPSK